MAVLSVLGLGVSVEGSPLAWTLVMGEQPGGRESHPDVAIWGRHGMPESAVPGADDELHLGLMGHEVPTGG